MKKKQIKHLPVIDNGEAIGIISDRDLQFITSSGAPDKIKCRDIMTEDPMTVRTNESIQEVARMMIEKKINSVLINNSEGKVVGIFTSTDALKLIEDYGADGVRVGLLLSAPAGNDLMFDIDLCKQGSGFVNKIWNAFKLIKGWEVDANLAQPESAQIALKWYGSKFQLGIYIQSQIQGLIGALKQSPIQA